MPRFGVSKAFTNDGGTHFTGQVMQMVSSRLGVVHHFDVAKVSWSHGTVERMNWEVVSCGPQRKTWASKRVPVGVGGCAVGSQFDVQGAHGDDTVSDDDGTTSCDGNLGVTGPWRVVPGGSEHVRVVEDIVTGETKELHVVRMRPYADLSLVVGAEVRKVFGMTKHQGEFEIAGVISVD